MIYENTKLYTIEKTCPWYDMQQRFGPPNVNWCEPTTCSIINEPANAWSNFGMILPGLIVYLISKNLKNVILKNFGLFIMVMGWFSFFYHSTNNYGTQFLDFVGMYLYTGAIITINLFRLKKSFLKSPWKVYSMVYILNIAIFWTFHFLGGSIQFTVILNILVMLLLEFLARDKTAQYKYFWLSLITVAIAQTFSLLDHTRVWCEPENTFLHGHALWHIFAGISSLFAYIFYKQFDEKLKTEF